MAAIDGGKVKSRILHARFLVPQRCHHDIAADALLRPPAPRRIRAVSADSISSSWSTSATVGCIASGRHTLASSVTVILRRMQVFPCSEHECSAAFVPSAPTASANVVCTASYMESTMRERRVHCLSNGKHEQPMLQRLTCAAMAMLGLILLLRRQPALR